MGYCLILPITPITCLVNYCIKSLFHCLGAKSIVSNMKILSKLHVSFLSSYLPYSFRNFCVVLLVTRLSIHSCGRVCRLVFRLSFQWHCSWKEETTAYQKELWILTCTCFIALLLKCLALLKCIPSKYTWTFTYLWSGM